MDPGNLNTPLYRSVPSWQRPIINLILSKPIFGAYTELYGGFSPDLTVENNGAFGKLLSQ
jgi:retinol dehydrogenase-12